MKAIFTHLNCLGDAAIRSPSYQVMLWNEQKLVHERTTSLVTSLGKPSITAPQAKRLDVLGFTFQSLLKLYTQSKDPEDFTKELKSKGVNSKALQVKLLTLLHSKVK